MVDEGAPEAERTWVHIVVSTLGAVVTAAILVALYYVLPLDDLSGASAVTGLALGIVVLVMLIGWQVRRILRSDHPGSRALEALFVAVPLFILLFATAYYLMGRADAEGFHRGALSYRRAVPHGDDLLDRRFRRHLPAGPKPLGSWSPVR